MGRRKEAPEKAQRTKKAPKEAWVQERQQSTASFDLTGQQKTLQNVIRENTLTFVSGPAGTGKTFGVLHYLCGIYNRDSTKNLYVVRTPAESAGKDKIGYLPNDLNAKIEPHFASSKKILCDILGKGRVEADLGKRLHFLIPNYLLGATLDNALILIDEAQMMEPLIMKLCLERIGENSICVVSGDHSQVYNSDSSRNGLSHSASKFFGGQYTYPDVGRFEFTVEDVMRSAIVKTVIKAYNNQPHNQGAA